MKRFYDHVGTQESEGGFQVTLDGRGIKTVRGANQIVPTAALAQSLASEWDFEGEEIDASAFPLRDMADYTIDVVAPARADLTANLVAYADTDTLLYRADPDEPLYARQQDLWEPIVIAFEARERVTLKRVSGIIHAMQDKDALTKLKARLSTLDPFTLAGLEAMTTLAASLTAALSAIEADAEPLALWQAASLEEEWQADQWGRDGEAEERRTKRQNDFLRAHEFVRLARETA
ncbi:MAG: ATP12 family protein [Pseudomonadota bacterium]